MVGAPGDPLAYDDAGGPVPYGDDVLAEDMGYVHGVNLADELDEVEGFAGAGEPCAAASLASEPQPRQPAMPAWARHVTAAGETGMLSPGVCVAGSRTVSPCAVGGRFDSVASGTGSSAPFRVRAVAASRRSLPPWRMRRRCWVCVPPCSTWTLCLETYTICWVSMPRTIWRRLSSFAAAHLPSRISWPHRCASPRASRSGDLVAAPENAELMARPVELLLDVLRRESDVVFVDTSVFWGDAVAAAVAASDRCLVVGDAAVSSATSASRVIELAEPCGRAAHAYERRVQPVWCARRRRGRRHAL